MRGHRLLSITAFATAFGAAFGVTFWATKPSFAAKFGPVDDHETLIWDGLSGHLPWSDFWSTFINQTEVGQWGAAGRFRPSYYLLRVGETVVLGNDPWAWYAGVLFMFTAACAILGYMASVWMSTAVDGSRSWVRWSIVLVASGVASFLFAGLYAWSGIVARLGPSEQLGLLATAVVLLSLTKLTLGLGRWWWIPALLGVTTAIFAKESFSALALAFPLIGAYSYLAFGRRKVDLVAGFLGVVPAVLLAAILGPTLIHNRHDIYGAGVGSSRLAGALDALVEPPLRRWLWAGGVVLLALLTFTLTLPKAERRVSAFLLAVVVWLFASVLIDAWFYGGNYALPRYRAITDLVITLMFVGAACLSVAAIRRGRGQSRAILVLAVASVAASSFFIVRLAQVSRANLRITHATAIDHAATSIEYQNGLSEVMAQLVGQRHPTVAVVATVGSDYELAFAIFNEVARRSADRDREYLIVEDPSPGADPLLDALVGISQGGAASWHIGPIGDLAGRSAVCVFLNQDPHPVDRCRLGNGVRVVAQGM